MAVLLCISSTVDQPDVIASSHRQQAFSHVLMVDMPAHVSVLILLGIFHLLLFFTRAGNHFVKQTLGTPL